MIANAQFDNVSDFRYLGMTIAVKMKFGNKSQTD
jgi:hypothetical protein